jgi:transposase InsO family protein
VLAHIALSAKIHAIPGGSSECYGAPRVHAELADDYGIYAAKQRVGRLMRAAGLRGVMRRGFALPERRLRSVFSRVERKARFYRLTRQTTLSPNPLEWKRTVHIRSNQSIQEKYYRSTQTG